MIEFLTKNFWGQKAWKFFLRASRAPFFAVLIIFRRVLTLLDAREARKKNFQAFVGQNEEIWNFATKNQGMNLNIRATENQRIRIPKRTHPPLHGGFFSKLFKSFFFSLCFWVGFDFGRLFGFVCL